MFSRRSVTTVTLLAALGLSVLAVSCGSPGSSGTTSTLSGGAPATGVTAPAGATTLSSAPTGTSAPGGGTWVTGETGDSILGKWHNNVTGETLEFFPNGTVTGTAGDAMGVAVTYAINGDQITISALGTILVTQTFSISGGMLTIIDNETGISGTLQRVE
jgi:hypothetical protein